MKHFEHIICAIESGVICNEYGAVTNLKTKRTLKQHPNDRGYLYVAITANKVSKWVRVHQFVWVFFKKTNVVEINHKDGNKLNNNIDNLERTTRKKNMVHAKKAGLLFAHKGEKCGKSKLNDKQVIEIRRLLSQKITSRKISEKFGVNEGTISHIKRRRTWKHLP